MRDPTMRFKYCSRGKWSKERDAGILDGDKPGMSFTTFPMRDYIGITVWEGDVKVVEKDKNGVTHITIRRDKSDLS